MIRQAEREIMLKTCIFGAGYVLPALCGCSVRCGDCFNALHIVPQPERALREIKRVLKDDGVLIAPTFTHAENSFPGKVKAFFMNLAGFPLHSKWTVKEYLKFLQQNDWTVRKSVVLKASFR